MDELNTILSGLSKSIEKNAATAKIHKSRSQTIATRVITIVKAINSNHSTIISDNDTTIKACFSMLVATMEEISDYFEILQKRGSTLGRRVKKSGSDEETFMKWNQTLLTCCSILDFAKVFDIFDPHQDLEDFNKDMEFLNENLKSILGNARQPLADLPVRVNRTWLEKQQADRTLHKTQQNFREEKTFDPKLIRYENIIGSGGIA